MTDVTRRAGGAPVSQDAPVATDGVTILGNGTQQYPLRGASVTPSSQIERVTSSGGVVTIDPDVELSIVTAQAILPAEIDANLAAPTENIDGYQKTILFTYTPVVDAVLWRLIAPVQSGLGIGWSYPGAGGAAVLVWDATAACWRASSIYLGTPIFA